ncbi:hypothetical protein ONZ45_g741 [Pleurotus djamor]|nr:hypothetical protein ONZ45_g741 [Pleurotus djamor]
MSRAKDTLWASGHDESVEVNQRALIDKVLARYSGEFSVFRELLQNSDDAASTAVEIHFETDAYLKKESADDAPVLSSTNPPDLKKTIVHQWTFKNNGLIFRNEDWNRLKKIAEGNPDEEKIGAFGVGFYSLFSVTEEPFVTSGAEWMGFYWKDKKDQLFARRGNLPSPSNEENPNPWTSFQMPLRDPSPIPPPFDFARFLASSIVFMTHLKQVSVYLDSHCLVKLSKAPGSPNVLNIPRSLRASSPSNSVVVKSIQATPLHISAEIMRLVYSSGSEKPAVPTALKPLQKAPGFFSSLFQSFAAPSTPQPLPTSLPRDPTDDYKPVTTDITLSIFSADVEVRLTKKVGDELLRATKKKPPAKVKYELIYTAHDEYEASKTQDKQQEFSTGSGHSTAQTTGIGGHMASRFIPTVERESLDFMDKNVAFWNKELLFVGGFLARCAYEFELDNIRTLWQSGDMESASAGPTRLWLQNRAIHALRFFTFRQSTPSGEVSSLLEQSFFGCGPTHQFPLLSTTGVRPISEIRLPDVKISTFLKSLPMVPASVLDEASLMITSLQNRRMISHVVSEDVIKELRAPLNAEEMIGFLQWWIDLNRQGQDPHLPIFRGRLLNTARLFVNSASVVPKEVPLSAIELFINARGPVGAHIPLGGPPPPNLLPIEISSKFTPEHLVSFLPWKEMTFLEWLKHICHPTTRALSAETDIASSPVWAERILTSLNRAWPSIPNTDKPQIAQVLGNVACIPTSQGQRQPDEAYFSDANILGDLPVIMLPSGTAIKGSLAKLVQYLGVRKYVDLQIVFTRYLVAVEDELKDQDWERLRLTPIFCKEGDVPIDGKLKRHRANELYEPIDSFRSLKLPTLAWNSKARWRPSNPEVKLLAKIGLQTLPPLTQLIDICCSSDPSVSSAALKYLLEKMSTHYPTYDPSDFSQKAYIPANKDSATLLATPLDVFIERSWASMGFLVLDESVQPHAAKLKISRSPSTSHLVQLLRTTPPSLSQARNWFSLLSTRITDFSDSELTVLGNHPFVPVLNDGSETGYTYSPPRRCLLNTATAKLQSKLFTCVDFGVAGNSFLSACGTKREASVEELAQMLLNDPQKFYKLSGGPQHFLIELRNIAINSRLLSSATFMRMKKSPILLGVRRRRKETFYAELGSRRLSSLIKQNYRTTQEVRSSDRSAQMHDLVLERLPLFLHGQTHARMKIPLMWLSKPGNFVVKTFGKINVETRLTFGSHDSRKTQEASAVATREGKGAVQLWTAFNTQIDMYEVATSLGRLLFEGAKASDILLFMTILSTDLRSLKRRGYNVDRILKQQKLAESAPLESQKTTHPPAAIEQPMTKSQAITPPTAPSPPTESHQHSPVPGGFPESPPRNKSRSTGFFKSIQDLRDKVSPRPIAPENEPLLHGDAPLDKPKQGNTRPITPSNTSHVTPLSNINSNIAMAIKACKPENGNLLRNKEEMRQVKESLNDGYCDVSGRAGDLNLIGEMGHLKIFVTQDVQDPQNFFSSKQDRIARFIHVMTPLANVYGLPLTSLHIFYDLRGDLIAFNRNASIFLNLRYFEAWHHDDVQKGKLDDAYISWFFTLAHEIAHNLVQPHNSEHEFYFSALCEKHIKGLGRLLATP